MTLLLCPDCCQWREPAEGRCPACAAILDLAVPDLSLETLAAEVGDHDQWLGNAELSRSVLPKRGRLHATTNGLLFVPNESRVIVFVAPPSPLASTRKGFGGEKQRVSDVGDESPLTSSPSLQGGEGNVNGWMDRLASRVWSRLSGRERTDRFACEQRPSELSARDRLALAKLLRSDPGVWFVARRSIANWRRQRGQWEFLRSDSRSWPERVAMSDRDGDRALQIWLETTKCPLPANVR